MFEFVVNTSGTYETKTARPYQDGPLKFRWRIRSERCYLAPHIVVKSYYYLPSRHLGYSSGQVAGSFLRIAPDVNFMIAKVLKNTSIKDSKVCHKNTSLLPPPSHQFRQHFEVQNPDQKTLKPVINQSLKDPTPGPFQ